MTKTSDVFNGTLITTEISPEGLLVEVTYPDGARARLVTPSPDDLHREVVLLLTSRVRRLLDVRSVARRHVVSTVADAACRAAHLSIAVAHRVGELAAEHLASSPVDLTPQEIDELAALPPARVVARLVADHSRLVRLLAGLALLAETHPEIDALVRP